MSNRNAKAALSKENEDLIAAGSYVVAGTRVDLRGLVSAATRDVASYTPDDTARFLTLAYQLPPSPTRTIIEVTPETSTAAAARLHAEGHHPTVLNYASATKPGGGYLTGATAQEEDLCRASALYTSLIRAQDFYDWHKSHRDARYSHRLVWTPNVPTFRDPAGALLRAPYLASFITAAAPNAGALAKNNPAALPQVSGLLRERAARILALAVQHGARYLVLGAWGCGVFRNSPADVAHVFATLLSGPFSGKFAKVVFAVYDTSASGSTLRAFEDAFPATPDGQTQHIDPGGVRATAAARRNEERRDGKRRDGERRDGERRDGERRDGERRGGERRDADRRDRDRREQKEQRRDSSSVGFRDRERGERLANATKPADPGQQARERAADAAAARAAAKPAQNTLDAWVIRK